jgi:hypothetical protein
MSCSHHAHRGFVNGGYINRNFPNTDPDSGGAAENTYEFFPSNGQAPPMPFMRNTSGLNAYPHTFLMSSGKMFIQANYSTSGVFFARRGPDTEL